MATLARSTVEDQPRSCYFLSMALAPIGAVPLWLSLYPNLWPRRKKDWASLRGLLCAGIIILLIPFYLVGYKEGVVNVVGFQREIKKDKSYLQYYPALDS